MAVLRIFILTSGLVGLIAQAQYSEIERLKGFAEHQSSDKKFDKERLKGEKEFNEEQEAWDRQQRQDLIDFKKSQAKIKAKDDGHEYRDDLKERQAWNDEYEKSRKAYAKDVKKFDRKNYPDLVNESTELGLDINRPRYALKSRGLYGAPTKYGKLGKGGALSGGSASSPPSTSGFGTGSNTGSQPAPSFPSPPPFDDFGDGGFVPSGDGFGDDIPPPPPPPPMPFDMNNEGGDGGFVPPPPPPPNFDGDFGGF